jgi:tRNA threonylcarbamoyladenosine biosynthesis protein TsaE
MPVVNTNCPEETVALGISLARLLAPGDFIALTGDLGAGKTQFARGVASGLHVDPSIPITSPTYTLLNIYQGRLPLYHFDLYRLQGAQDVVDLGFDEYFYGEGVCLVEWAERLAGEIPREHLTICFSHSGDDTRILEFIPSGQRAEDILRNLFTDKKMF